MTQQRLPASFVVSFAVHAGFLALFLGVAQQAPQEAQKIVEGVDLLIAPKPKDPGDGQPKRKPAPISTMDFLKMALPSKPRGASLANVELKVEARKPQLAEAPKLQDSMRKDLGPKLEALDLSRDRVSAAKIDAMPSMSRRQAAATLAALPRLEDVGRRRVKNLPEALELEERRREVGALSGASGLGTVAPSAPTRRQALAAVATLQEAAPSGGTGGAPAKSGLSILPDRIELGSGRGGSGGRPALAQAPIAETPKLQRRQAAAATVQRKNLEIEGPLADRRIVSYSVPSFPDWAKQQGILEAEVAIRFNVDAEGSVLSDMRVERTSGYGRLDRLAMESLKTWKFAPAPGSAAQWGVITFRFLLE